MKWNVHKNKIQLFQSHRAKTNYVQIAEHISRVRIINVQHTASSQIMVRNNCHTVALCALINANEFNVKLSQN